MARRQCYYEKQQRLLTLQGISKRLVFICQDGSLVSFETALLPLRLQFPAMKDNPIALQRRGPFPVTS